MQVVIVLALALTLSVVSVGPAASPAHAQTVNRWTDSWGYGKNFTFSKDLTRRMTYPASVTSIVAGTIGGVPGRVIAAASGLVAAAAARASERNACLRIRMTQIPGTFGYVITYIGVDATRRCWSR